MSRRCVVLTVDTIKSAPFRPLAKSPARSCARMGFVWVVHSTSTHNQPAASLFLGGFGPNCVDTSRHRFCPRGVDTSSLPQIATGFELNFRATSKLRFTESCVWSSPLAHSFMKNATSETTRPILTSTRTINETPGTDIRLSTTEYRRASRCSWSTPGTSRRVTFTFSLWLGFHHPRVAASLDA